MLLRDFFQKPARTFLLSTFLLGSSFGQSTEKPEAAQKHPQGLNVGGKVFEKNDTVHNPLPSSVSEKSKPRPKKINPLVLSENVGITQLDPIGITQGEAQVLTAKLRSELIATGKFKVLERNKMDEILTEQGFQQTGVCSDAACLVEMGQLLGVTEMIAGSIGKVGRSFSINVRLFSVKTGAISKEVSHSHKGTIDQLLEKEMGVVAKKMAGLEIKKKKSRTWIWVVGGVVGVTTGILLANPDTFPPKEDEEEKKTFDLEVEW